jgi:hypothetical protein
MLAVGACTTRKDQPAAISSDTLTSKTDTVIVAEEPAVVMDKSLDALALYVAGLPQRDSNAFSSLEKERIWKDFKLATDSNWTRIYNLRLGKMQEWQKENLGLRDSLSVFYPFSGPDFMHVHYLFPEANEYIFVALEPIAPAPRFDTLSADFRTRFLDSLQHSLLDVFNKSYFITSKMKRDIKNLRGVLVPLYFFIERTGHELISQEFIRLDSTGNEVTLSPSDIGLYKTAGVHLRFREHGSQTIKELRYFSVNVNDNGMNERPGLDAFIIRNGPYHTFLKSASYLLHRENFSQMRKIVMDNSIGIFQDDTGVPYREFKKRLDWQVQLYGQYAMPVKEFGEARFQADLDSAYRVSSNSEALPFSIGYHWGTKKQNYMLMKKSTVGSAK